MLKHIDIPFTGPLSEKSAGKVLGPPALTKAENLISDRDGRVTKRAGVSQIGEGVSGPGDLHRAVSFGDELLFFDSERLWTEGGDTGIVEVEDSTSVVMSERRTLGVYGRHSVISTAAAANTVVRVEAWGTTDGTTYRMHVLARDASGGVLTPATEVPITSSSGVSCIKAVSVGGNKVFVLWGEDSNLLRGVIVDSSTQGAWEAGDIVTFASDCDQSDIQFFDMAPHGTQCLLAYQTTSGTNVQLKRLDSSNAQLATALLSGPYTSSRIGIVGNVDNSGSTVPDVHLYLQSEGATPTTDARLEVYAMNQDFTVESSYLQGPSGIHSTLGIACGEFNGTRNDNRYKSVYIIIRSYETEVRISDATGAALKSEDLYGVTCVSKPFTRNERVHFVAQYRADQSNSFLALVSVDMSQSGQLLRVESRFGSGLAPASLPANIAVTVGEPYAAEVEASPLADTVLTVPLRILERVSDPSLLASADAAGQTAVSIIRANAFDFSLHDYDQFQPVELGGSLYLGGGSVLQYDGRRLTELGFYCYPDINADDVTASSAGGSMVAGDYIYSFVWEWYDTRGNRHQSAPKLVNVTVPGTSNSSVVVDIPAFNTSRKLWRRDGSDARPVVCAVYRTEPGGVILYRLEGDGVDPYAENVPDYINSGTWTDTVNGEDINITSHEVLYTSSAGANELDNVPPPPSRFIIAHQGRLFGIKDEDPTQLWFSKQAYPGMGLAWNEALIVQLQEPATGLASQDGNLVVFSRDNIYTVMGQAPSNTGLGTNYESPQKISLEVGLKSGSARSLLSSPVGTFFESERGLMLLPRGGLEPVYVGQDVERTSEDYPLITASVHIPASSRVAFAVATDEVGGDSRVLVHDYRLKTWYVNNYGNDFVIRGLADDGGRLVGCSKGYLSTEDHYIFREDDGYSDSHGGSELFIPTILETGDIRFGGLSGYSRCCSVTILGQNFSPTTLEVHESHDGGTTWDYSPSWDIDSAEQEVQRTMHLVNQKSGQVRFRINQVDPGGGVNTQGLALYGMRVEYKQVAGKARLPSWSRL